MWTRHCDDSGTVRKARAALVNPFATRTTHRVSDSIDADAVVMIAANGEHRCNLAELAGQQTQLAQLGCVIQQIATQEHGICLASRDAIDHLLAEHVGTTVSQVNIADVHQPARIVPY
jgi:hypothetical protein